MLQKELEKWEACLADFDKEMTLSEYGLAKELLNQLEKVIPANSSLLEIGCGSGHISSVLSENYKVSIADFSEKVVEVARTNFEKNGAVLQNSYVANMFEMSNMISHKFDAVWNSGVLEHYEDSEIVKALVEMKKVSNKFVVTLVPNANCFLYNLWREHITELGDWKWGQEYAKNTMVPYFQAAGLNVLLETYVGQEFSRDYTYALPGVEAGFRDILNKHLNSPSLSNSFGYLVLTIGIKEEVKQESRVFQEFESKNEVTNFSYKDFVDYFKPIISQKDEMIYRLSTQYNNYSLDKEKYIAQLIERNHNLELQLNKMFLYRVKKKIKPLLSKTKRKMKNGLKKILKIDNGNIENPYERMSYLKKIDVIISDELYRRQSTVAATLIATCYNEGKKVIDWLASISEQSVLPEEVIIVDGGSTDETVKYLESSVQNYKGLLNIKLIKSSERINISVGRNIAISNAKNEIIIASDFGTTLSKNFIEEITNPFLFHTEIDLAFSKYDVQDPTQLQEEYKKYFVPDWDLIDHEQFIPSSRGIAFRKEAWERAGGYPEWLTRTGEDTLFAIDLRKHSRRWAYCPNTTVFWNFPNDKKSIHTISYNYGKGDGENGLYGLWDKYPHIVKYQKLMENPFKSLQLMLPINKALGKDRKNKLMTYYNIKGLLDAKSSRIKLLLEKNKMIGNVLVLSGIPFYDSGGGQRGTQMSLEFIRNKYKVTFVNVYPSYESNDKIYIDTDYSLLELIPYNHFDALKYIEEHREILNNTIVIMEFPHPSFIEIIKTMKKSSSNIRIVYDCVDKWDTSLGGEWYSENKELQIIDNSDMVIASAIDLQEGLMTKTDKPVHYIPQGLNLHLFNRRSSYLRPIDLPDYDKIILYIGALWGDWFDWSLLEEVSIHYPDYAVVCIGDYKGEAPFKRANVFFLGLKQQYNLPGYLAHSDVCIIPFKVNDLTQAVNPLKVYEYLAMGKPVVTTNLKEISGFPYVYSSTNSHEFVENIQKAINSEINYEVIDEFVSKNSWFNRVGLMLSLLKSRG